MKTQLVYLDAHDDVASALERLRWAKADRVVFIWPSYGRVLHHRLDLVRLARESSRQAAQLGVVSHDPDVRAEARRLDIAVFDDLDAVSRRPWPKAVPPAAFAEASADRPQRPARPAVRGASGERGWSDARRAAAMLVVIAALLALSIVVGPAAVIELVPTETLESTRLDVSFAQEDGGAIPFRTVSVDVAGEVQIPTRGTVQVETSSAQGTASFTNRSAEEVVIPEGTGLRTSDDGALRFETTERAVVPAGIGERADVPIRAAAAGPSGNVPAGAIAAIEGTLGLDLTVTNLEATSGGASKATRGVTATDLDQARTALVRQLVQTANALLQESLEEGETMAPESVTVAQVLASEFRPPPGEPSQVIQGTMTARVDAIAYSLDRLQAAAEGAIAEQVADDRELVPGSLEVSLDRSSSDDPWAYQAIVEGRSRPRIDFGSLAQSIRGRTPAEAARLLAQRLDLQAAPVFRMWPGWWSRLPLLTLRIQPVWLSPP